jgi:hypothetical protein
VSSVAAAGHEVVPKGTIPDGQDVIVLPGGDLLVTDAVGVGAGRVVKISGTTASPLISGLDYVAGLALDGSTLLVGNVDSSFLGAVLRYALDGTSQGALASGLSGEYGLAVDGDGNVLASGLHNATFTDSSIAAIAPGGAVTQRADGFGFSADLFYDAARDELLVLDFGVHAITAICRDANTDGICDADQVCNSPAAVEKAKVVVGKLKTPAGDDTLTFTGEMTGVPMAPALDPLTKGVHVRIADASGVVLDAHVPGGAAVPHGTGWKVKKTTWTYKGDGSIGGITKVVVKEVAKTPGLVKFVVKGKNGSYPASVDHLPLDATFVLDPAGQCSTAAFGATACVFNSKKGTLGCK